FIQDISSVSLDFENMVKKELPATIEECAITYVDHLFQNESTFQMMTYILLKDNLDKSALAEFGSITKVFFDTFERLLRRYGAQEDVRLYVHALIAAMTGIIITFRNHPIKEKQQIREHIFKVTKIMADLFSNKLIK
ncbi:MAG: TetR/AcrR family transcriptional regulator, partial [Desulfamplus sp.]|nr:TetR/AcrR family transcriptional regulator [Desulfamplus sp.]